MRGSRGSLLPLVALSATVFVFGLVFLCQLAIHWLSYQKVQAASEAAALVAANDIADLVINDPHFGFVSLSNGTAGKSTVTETGEHVPVIGINTILATCRSNLLIAEHLGSVQMRTLALRDLQHAREASRALQVACTEALKPNSSSCPCDSDGNKIEAYKHAEESFKNSMGWMHSKFTLSEMKLEMGWLDVSSSSMTAIPRPVDLSEVPPSLNSNGDYSAFVNIPLDGADFYFAGLAPNSALASAARFHAPDGKRVCSAIKIRAKVMPKGCDSFTDRILQQDGVAAVACSVPEARHDVAPPAVMALSFPHGRVNQLRSFADMLASSELSRENISIKHSAGGDFPDDPGAQLVDGAQNIEGVINSPSDLVAKGMYDWLRTCHGKVRLDSVIATVNAPFSWDSSAPQSLLYGLEKDGSVKLIQSKVFTCQTIHDKQEYAAADEVQAWGKSWTFTWRDEVSNLGNDGGKHGGLPLFDRRLNAAADHTYQRNGLAVAMEFSSPL